VARLFKGETDLLPGDYPICNVMSAAVPRRVGEESLANNPIKINQEGIAMAKEKNTKQVNVKKEPTKSLKEKRAAKQAKREEKQKDRG